ncbi:Na/Pi cotransporter family protein [Benzoatithermus flavus]|uniref:Na/Pi cotransporter family protein n=1 Tax=Benzoatithermus flavus TaxID=3108223 RepID=A0ABU8XLZ6_9PROT
MPATHALINLLGEVALLLWGIHMVRGGVMNAFGSSLRRALGACLRNRLAACLAGAGVTLTLQSSTATAMMATSFLSGGVIDLVPALAVMLGANLGTALAARLLAFDVALVFPVLLLAGYLLFKAVTRSDLRNLAKALIGLGLVLLALHLLVDTIAPGAIAPEARELLATLTREPLPDLVLAAAVAWAAHSSLAVVLVIASLAGAGILAPEPALAMVLGANLGSALNPLSAAHGDRAALRLPLGNLLNRLIGCAIAMPFLPEIEGLLRPFSSGPGRLAVDFHLLFNAALAVLFLLPLPLIARALERALPSRPNPADPGNPLYLDPDALHTPAVALANAERETLRMADVVEAMLRDSQSLLSRDDEALVAGVRRMDDVLDRLRRAIELYLSALDRSGLDPQQRQRLAQIQVVALNLEHAGDIVDKGLMPLAAKRIRRRLRFGEEELTQARAVHAHLLSQLRLAVAVFMADDLQAAIRLVEEKEGLRELERSATAGHYARLRENGGTAAETGALHLDVIRDLKRIEAHLAATAHPLLERRNLLRRSRLVPVEKTAGDS